MAKKKISAKNITILTINNMALSAAVGISASYMFDWPISGSIAGTNLLSLMPLLFSSGNALRKELGLSSPVQIAGNWSKKTFGRSITVNAGETQKDVFLSEMNILQLNSGKEPKETEEIAELESVSIWYNDNSHTITMPDLKDFVFMAYRRQRLNENGFSRRYWTKDRRPAITTLDYDLRMFLLCSIDGLVINRGPNRSGKLTLPPNETMKKIKAAY